MLDNLSIKIFSDLIDFDTNGESRQTPTVRPKITILLSISKELFTCKLHLSLPATQRRAVCLSLCTSGGLAREGKQSLLDNFSIKILSDRFDFYTDGQSRRRATL